MRVARSAVSFQPLASGARRPVIEVDLVVGAEAEAARLEEVAASLRLLSDLAAVERRNGATMAGPRAYPARLGPAISSAAPEGCQWILGPPGWEAKKCDLPTRGRGAWCPAHRRVVYPQPLPPSACVWWLALGAHRPEGGCCAGRPASRPEGGAA